MQKVALLGTEMGSRRTRSRRKRVYTARNAERVTPQGRATTTSRSFLARAVTRSGAVCEGGRRQGYERWNSVVVIKGNEKACNGERGARDAKIHVAPAPKTGRRLIVLECTVEFPETRYEVASLLRWVLRWLRHDEERKGIDCGPKTTGSSVLDPTSRQTCNWAGLLDASNRLVASFWPACELA